MKLAVIAAVIALLCVGCATVHESYAPDGRKAYTLNCSGLARGWDKCYSAAGDICKSAGYDILEPSDEPVSMTTVGGSAHSFAGSSASTNERSMVVACKVAFVPAPAQPAPSISSTPAPTPQVVSPATAPAPPPTIAPFSQSTSTSTGR